MQRFQSAWSEKGIEAVKQHFRCFLEQINFVFRISVSFEYSLLTFAGSQKELYQNQMDNSVLSNLELLRRLCLTPPVIDSWEQSAQLYNSGKSYIATEVWAILCLNSLPSISKWLFASLKWNRNHISDKKKLPKTKQRLRNRNRSEVKCSESCRWRSGNRTRTTTCPEVAETKMTIADGRWDRPNHVHCYIIGLWL